MGERIAVGIRVGVGVFVGPVRVHVRLVEEAEQYEKEDPVGLKQYGALDAHSDEYEQT